MQKLTTILLGMLLIAASAPACAQQAEPAPLPTEEPALPVLSQIAGAPDDAARLALFDRALGLLLQPTPLRGRVLCGRAALLSHMHRDTEARQGFAQCRQLRPDDPAVLLTIAVADSAHGEPAEAARLIMRVASLQSPILDKVETGFVDSVLRQLHYASQDALSDSLIDALVAAGYARDDPRAFSGYVHTAIERRLRDGDTAAALQLLPSVVAPDIGIAMLVDRQFAPIWPAVEQWAGDDLSVQRRTLLNAARATFETTGTAAARLAYARALVATGHRGDAIEMIDTWLLTDLDKTDQWERSMAVLQQGRWFAEQGQRAEGIKRMRAALAVPSAPQSGVGNIAPNLVLQLLLAHDYAGAIEALDRYTPPPAALESPAAAGYFVALRACALQGLGRHDQASAQRQRLKALYPTADAARDYAEGCVGTPDEQAQLWIAQARNPRHRSDALVKLVTARYRIRKGLPPLTLEEEMLRRIDGRADVRAAFDELGRALPEKFEPALDDFNAVPPPPSRPSGPVA